MSTDLARVFSREGASTCRDLFNSAPRPIDRGAGTNDGFPPTAADFRMIKDGPPSDPKRSLLPGDRGDKAAA